MGRREPRCRPTTPFGSIGSAGRSRASTSSSRRSVATRSLRRPQASRTPLMKCARGSTNCRGARSCPRLRWRSHSPTPTKRSRRASTCCGSRSTRTGRRSPLRAWVASGHRSTCASWRTSCSGRSVLWSAPAGSSTVWNGPRRARGAAHGLPHHRPSAEEAAVRECTHAQLLEAAAAAIGSAPAGERAAFMRRAE